MNLNRIIPYVLTLSLILGLYIWHSHVNNEKEELLLNSTSTNALIIDFTDSMGNEYLNYVYIVDEKEYYASKRIKASLVKENLIGSNNLKIEYSNEKPEISIIVDTRFK